jgi:hypothetical protein
VIAQLARLSGQPAKHVEAILETFESVGVKEQRDFAMLLEAEILRLVSPEQLLDDSGATF